ncbi:hypothetical protein QR680_012661 [Steinernema hermaphroditum]|uniref:Protein pelota homolog n=1 Tax=Steinernema hermaphroditum TaxID=289476 RepID=A0AA39I2R8_9BILA|nr:hypothetical protein QR680_012661 [Steinernema hermaphroditum]
MRCFKRYINKDGSGDVSLMCEEREEMWHIYNLIRSDDIITMSTARKVVNESATGSVSTSRVMVTLSIQVEDIDFDAEGGALHLKGRNVAENDYVKIGAYHTHDIEINRRFKLYKNNWDSIDLERLEEAMDSGAKADVAVIVMHEGIARVCLVTSTMTIVKASINMQIPRKRKGFTQNHEKGMDRFYNTICLAFFRHVNLEVVKCVVIGSPGFVRDQFMDYLTTYADKEGIKSVVDNKSKFILAHCSSGFKRSVKELLEQPALASKLSDTKAQAETKALNEFYELMSTEPDRAFYGYNHVLSAVDLQAVESLLLSDKLFRSNSIAERQKYVRLVEAVKEQNGSVLIFSSMHVSGEQLGLLSGVAAILRYPCPQIEDLELSDGDDAADDLPNRANGATISA